MSGLYISIYHLGNCGPWDAGTQLVNSEFKNYLICEMSADLLDHGVGASIHEVRKLKTQHSREVYAYTHVYIHTSCDQSPISDAKVGLWITDNQQVLHHSLLREFHPVSFDALSRMACSGAGAGLLSVDREGRGGRFRHATFKSPSTQRNENAQMSR